MRSRHGTRGALRPLAHCAFILALYLAIMPITAMAASIKFPDVSDATPHADDITWLASNGITGGFPDGTYRGEQAVTRQDMAAFLRRLANLMGDESAEESNEYTCDFKDVTEETSHAKDIAWLAETGITKGYPDNTFRGMEPVRRQDMAAFLRRLAARLNVGGAAKWKGEPGGFPDVGPTADHAADIAWLAASKVSTGYPDGTFRGMAAVARQDMAAFLHRLHDLPKDKPGAAPTYAEWASRMVVAIEGGDSRAQETEPTLQEDWTEAQRIGIIPFDVENRDKPATRDFALCCAALACGFTEEGSEGVAPDIGDSKKPALIDAAVKAGIGKSNEQGLIRPNDVITDPEADAAEARVNELLKPAAKEPEAEWKPAKGVEEIAGAAVAGDEYIVPVPAKDIKTGDKVILEPSEQFPSGAAGTVESAREAGTGKSRIKIRPAKTLDEVFDEVHIEAVDAPLQLGIAAQNAGIQELSDDRLSAAYEIPFSFNPADEVSIDGKVTVSATLQVDWKRGLGPSRVTAVLSPSASLKVKALLEHEFKGVEISLLPVDLSVPLGVTGAAVTFNASLTPSLNGNFSVSTSAHFSAGVDYFDGHFRAIRDAGIDMPELEGEFSFDLGPNAGFAFFGIDIASIQPKIIPGIWGQMDFRDSGMVCSDVSAYVGVGITGKLDVLDPLSSIINNKFDFVQIGRDETPLKWDWHWEDGHLVPGCTYRPEGNPDEKPAEFSDISPSTPHYSSILWLIEKGVANYWANEDGTLSFRPYENTTRADMALFLYRMAGRPSFNTEDAATFTDIDMPGEYRRAILWLSVENITQGWDNGDGTKSFRPNDYLTREQMSVFLYRYTGEPNYDEPATSPYCDISDSSPNRRAILWVSEIGLSHGWANSDGTQSFRPHNSILRCDMADFLYRFNSIDLGCTPEDAYCTLFDDGTLIISASRFTDLSKREVAEWQGLGTRDWYEKKKVFKAAIKYIEVKGEVKAPQDFSNMGDGLFQYLPHLISLNLKNLDMSKTISCSSLLYGCESIRTLDLSDKDLGSLEHFSLGVCNLESLSFANSDLHSLYNLYGFQLARSIEEIDFSNCDLSSMSDWSQMFQATSLQMAQFSGAKLAEFCNFGYMFADCSSLSVVNLLFAKNTSAKTLTCMFAACPSITQLDLSRLSPARDKWGGRIETPSMFKGCSNLHEIIGINQWNLNGDAWTDWMFDGCPAPRPPWYSDAAMAA